MTTEANNRAYYNDFAERYEHKRHRGYHTVIDDLEMATLEPLAKNRRVLEVGSGTGLILRRLQAIAKEAKGIDLSENMAQKAIERGLDVQVGSATAIPFEDNRFDVVCSFKVLAHVPDISQALREMVRVTVPGGYIVAEFYNPWSVRYIAKRIAGPRAISERRTEADVYTRWDSPLTIAKIIPADARLIDFRGVRVLTPAAFVYSIPFAQKWLAQAESAAMTSSLRYFGGFLLALLQKQD
ncbi:MAG: class I SAM-dependent methyltransferase [Myxococcales bacterium]|nr:class I SAM-dependent methyltransferase [Myxococcales bacterium]MCB9708628.1 class I SAM-dependent methyltransferase [Myxococcales bacterium]